MLSGRSTVLCARVDANADQIVQQCCWRMGITQSGKEKLIHGTEVLPATTKVESWPGLRSAGE
eukprot:6008046-Amphidinium_carterae.1